MHLIHLVETPGGFRTSANPQRFLDPVLAYLGLQFQSTNEFFSRSALSDDALGRFLVDNTMGAHTHVDICLYIVHGQLWPVDIQYMKQLSGLVNLVPVLVPAETTPPGQVRLDRLELMHQLSDNGLEIYGMNTEELLQDFEGVGSSRGGGDSDTGDRSAGSPRAQQAPDPLISVPMIPFLSPPFVLYLSSGIDSPSSSAPEDPTTATTHRSSHDIAEEKVSQLSVSSQQQQQQQQQKMASRLPLLPKTQSEPYSSQPGTVDQSLLDLWNSQQMRSMRDWILVTHLDALRYHTTLKFLAWRRQLPWMALSDSLCSQQDSSGHGSVASGDGSAGDSSGGSGASLTGGAPPLAHRHRNHLHRRHQLQHHRPPVQPNLLPSEHLAQLQASSQQRITDAVVKILESEAVVLRRILEERQEAWRRALEQMEREERVEFLVQELKRWAREGNGQRYGDGMSRSAPEAAAGTTAPIHTTSTSRYEAMDTEGIVIRDGDGGDHATVRGTLDHVSSESSSARGQFLGSGLERGGLGGAPSQHQQHQWSSADNRRASTIATTTRMRQQRPSMHSGRPWLLSANKVSSTSSTTTSSRTRSRTRRSKTRSREGDAGFWDTRPVLSLKAAPPSSSKRAEDGEVDEAEEEDDVENGQSDPLGLGSVVGRVFGAVGHGLVNVFVLATMTGLAQWVYSNFLENLHVEWIL
ncbi:septin 2 [Actinomortierella ambigua]|nr:septin 2 [Actinomortierella ambigua]